MWWILTRKIDSERLREQMGEEREREVERPLTDPFFIYSKQSSFKLRNNLHIQEMSIKMNIYNAPRDSAQVHKTSSTCRIRFVD